MSKKIQEDHLDMIENVIMPLVKCLQDGRRGQADDGRRVSVNNEEDFLSNLRNNKYIKKVLHIPPDRKRSFYDFALITKEVATPVNFKSSTSISCDNMNAKAALAFVFCKDTKKFKSGKNCLDYYNDLNRLSHEEFIFYWRKNDSYESTGKDYFFINHDKKHPEESFLSSLQSLCFLRPNRNNPPFQIDWKMEMGYNPDYETSHHFCLIAYAQSIKKLLPVARAGAMLERYANESRVKHLSG